MVENDIGPNPPKCRCGSDAFVVVGRQYMCGKCVMDWQKFQKEKQEKEMKEFQERQDASKIMSGM